MNTLIVATDFSTTSRNAANYAMDMAMVIQADVLLLHVYQLPASYGEMTLPVDVGNWEQEAEDLLDAWKKELIQRGRGVVTVDATVKIGGFYIELENLCEKVNPYAVIMGSKGTSAAERFLFGSHAIFTMKHLPWPAITVPPGASFNYIKKIGLACDFGEPDTEVPAKEINKLVKNFDAELHVLNAEKTGHYDPQAVLASGHLRTQLKDSQPQFHFMAGNNPDSEVLDFVRKNGIDLLIVLPGHHNWVDAIFHKSHTKQWVLQSPVPLMSLHYHEQPVTTHN
ncbi:MAG: universal stress protein [Niastella sp.]|nr:universal stress protein [Niastella sp.]